MGSAGKLDGGRADSFPRPWRSARKTARCGASRWRCATPIRRSPPCCPRRRFLGPPRFARVRFDAARRANYRCHWLSEDEIKQGTFGVAGIFSNGANLPTPFEGAWAFTKEAGCWGPRPLPTKPGRCPPMTATCNPAGLLPAGCAERARHVRANCRGGQAGRHDRLRSVRTLLAEAPGERDWLKRHFAKEFTLHVGPYPSQGALEYAIDCLTLMEALRGGPGRGDGDEWREGGLAPASIACQRTAGWPERFVSKNDRRHDLRDHGRRLR